MWFKKKLKKLRLEVDSKTGISNIPPTFKLCVKYFMDNDPTAKIKVGRKENSFTFPKNVGTMDVKSAWEIVENVEDTLRTEYGGGDFVMAFQDASGAVFAEYSFSVAGPDKTPKSSSDGASRAGENKIMEMLAMSMIDSEGVKAKNLAEARAMEMQAMRDMLTPANQGGGLLEDLVTTLINNQIVDKTNARDEARAIIETANQIAPQISGQDGTTALITALVPLLTTMIMSRGSASGNGGVSPDQIRQFLGSLPQDQKEQVMSLLGQKPEASRLPTREGRGASVQASLEGSNDRPSMTEDPDRPSSIETARASHLPTDDGRGSQPRSSSAFDSKEDYKAIILNLYRHFRQDIIDGVAVDNLANKLIAMIQMAQLYLGKNTPEPLTDLANHEDPEQTEGIFDAFCSRCPELSSRPQLCMLLKLHLARMLGALDDLDDGIEDEEPDLEPDHDQQPISTKKQDRDISADIGGEREAAENAAC